jgi:N-carbamoylputrescine amidase
VGGCFELSSNRVDASSFGGRGWVISPDGVVLATTSNEKPFVTVEVSLKEAEEAKKEYPRYIQE